MAHRTFVDGTGVTWIVWDVSPDRIAQHQSERRARDRRVAESSFPGPERRAGERRGQLRPEMSQGWLAFRSGRELRRLVPIPAGWFQMSDPELDALCRTATPTTERMPPPA